jgi:sugar-specific transcriptional regulator TrmB
MFEKILTDIGLTKGEAKVYSSLNKLGESTIGPIIDNSGISRSKIYDVLERLIKKGLVSYIKKDRTKYFQANEPSKIKDFLKSKEKIIQGNLIEVEKIIPLMLKTREKQEDASSVQVYEGFQGIMTAHDHVFSRLKKGEEYFFYGISAFQEEKYHSIWKEDHEKRVSLGIKCKLLFNRKTSRKVMKNRNDYKYCDARYMPEGMETPAWVMGYKNVTLIGLQSKKGLAIEIVNKEIAQSFKSFFRVLWNLSKSYK